jgi:hypothetical protein
MPRAHPYGRSAGRTGAVLARLIQSHQLHRIDMENERQPKSPRYRFFLNPDTDVRFTPCPQCRGKTSQLCSPRRGPNWPVRHPFSTADKRVRRLVHTLVGIATTRSARLPREPSTSSWQPPAAGFRAIQLMPDLDPRGRGPLGCIVRAIDDFFPDVRNGARPVPELPSILGGPRLPQRPQPAPTAPESSTSTLGQRFRPLAARKLEATPKVAWRVVGNGGASSGSRVSQPLTQSTRPALLNGAVVP